MPPLSSIQAAIIAVFTEAVGLLVAFVPSFAPDQQILISAGTSLIAAVFLIGNAIIHHGVTTAAAKASAPSARQANL